MAQEDDEIYVEPPQLVTAGVELVMVAARFAELRAYAQAWPFEDVHTGAGGDGDACSTVEGSAVASFDMAWSRVMTELRQMAGLIAIAGGKTYTAAAHYTGQDEDGAGGCAKELRATGVRLPQGHQSAW